MTVRKLIELLSQMNPKARVVCECYDTNAPRKVRETVKGVVYIADSLEGLRLDGVRFKKAR